MRRVLVLVLVLAGAAPAARAQTIVAGPVATQITATVGERLTVPVAVNMTGAPGIDLGSYRARFTWNPGLMRLVSVTGGTFATPVANADTAAQGVLWFAAASGQGLGGVPVLADITFEVLSLAAADTFRLSFAEMHAATTFQDLLPFLSVTTGSFCAGAVWGDLDQNGTIQAVDAQIALMHAVGMAVSDTTNGDVDADGTVGTRDALIILSDVIDLDVTAFRVGTLMSGLCQNGAPELINVFPGVVTLAAGDTFRLSAQVRDTAGNLAPGVQLAWMSSDPGRASVDSLGVVRALTDGAVTITASVSPTVSGTGSVTVGPRHRWRVDPAGAQGALVELGSDAYPFSTIARAVEHAAAGDTIAIAVGRYAEPLLAAKPLVFLGDSGVGGMPVLTTPNQPAASLSGPGRHVVRRFTVTESQAGFEIRGDTIDLQSLGFSALRGPAIQGVGSARATVRGVTVDGIRKAGVAFDSAGVVQLAQVRVTGVEPPDDSSGAAGVFVRADSVFLDTVTISGVGGVGVLTRDAERTRLRRVHVAFADDGVRADSGATLEVLDSTRVDHIRGGGGVGGDLDSLRVLGAVLEDIEGPAVWFGFAWFGYDQLRLEQTRIERVGNALVAPYFGTTALLRQLVVRGIGGDALVLYAGAVRADTVRVERAGGDGLYASGASQLDVTGSTFQELLGVAIGGGAGTGRATISGTSILLAGGGIEISNDSLILVGDTIVESGDYGIYHTNGLLLHVRDVLVRRTGDNNLYVYSTQVVDIARSRFDTAGTQGYGAGISAYYADSVFVDSSAVEGARDEGILVAYTPLVRIRHDTLVGNFRAGSALGGLSYDYGAIGLGYVDSAIVRRNVMRDNRGNSVGAYLTSGDQVLLVDSNSMRGAWAGVYASGPDSVTSRVHVTDNAFVGRLGGGYARAVFIEYIGRVRVTGNTFDSITGVGVWHYFGDSLLVDDNTITNLGDRDGTPALGINPYRVGTALVSTNAITCTGTSLGSGLHAVQATTTATGNTVTACARGLTALNDGGYTDTVTFTGNRVNGGATTVGGLVVRRRTVATFAGNVVTGGVLSEGAYAALGTVSYRVPRVSLAGDSVQGGSGNGIRMEYVDTAMIGGVAVDGLASLYADATTEAGIWLANISDTAWVHGSRVAGGGDDGIVLTGTARGVALDSNLVVDHAGAGVAIRTTGTDTVWGSANGIRRNQAFGIWTGTVSLRMPGNDIAGNGFGVWNDDADVVDVTNSWWGDALGPTCDIGLEYCDPSSVGDSIGGYQVGIALSAVPFATAGVTGVPAGGAPVFAASGARVGRPAPRLVPLEPVMVATPRPAPPPPPAPPAPRGDR